MTISGYRSEWKQLLLWDPPLPGPAIARHVIGNLVEELTARVFGGRRHKTDNTVDYCPDVSVAGPAYLECKGIGRSRTPFIYAGRLLNDRNFVEHGHDLFYVVWHHTARTLQAGTVGELEELVCRHMKELYVVPFQAIDAICRMLQPVKLNSKYGPQGSETYAYGFRFRLALLRPHLMCEWAPGTFDIEQARQMNLWSIHERTRYGATQEPSAEGRFSATA